MFSMFAHRVCCAWLMGALAAGSLAVADEHQAFEAHPSPGSPSTKLSLDWIRPSCDGTHFVYVGTGQKVVMWGFNYDHDEQGRLLEDYWAEDWPRVAEDFGEMKALGANVVRIHLQVAKFLDGPQKPNSENLARLSKLVQLAEQCELYLDLTGLACYHKQDVPAWYDALNEADRWAAQACFWRAVAETCQASPAIFCYDLMNEPILAGAKGEETEWLTGELGGKFFVQRITLDLAGRTRQQVARQWVEKMTAAIREVDKRHMITVGVIPWALTFHGAKPLFYSEEVGRTLDFVSVHFYPRSGEVEAATKALQVYEVGKPLVIEETFPLKCSQDELETFIRESASHCDGWISFYWGQTIEEYAEQGGLRTAIIGAWLRKFRELIKR